MSELSNEAFFQDVKEILAQARGSAARAVNSAMVEAYWTIGKRIVEEEQGGQAQAAYGSGLLEELSKSLSAEFGQGFSLANLKNFRKFYLTYPDEGKGYALRSLLSWTHHRSIMRVEDPEARQYYLETCEKENWSSRVLERQIKTNTFQRLLSTESESSAEPSPRDQIFSRPNGATYVSLGQRPFPAHQCEAHSRPNGATYVSLGRSPRNNVHPTPQALKGRAKADGEKRPFRPPFQGYLSNGGHKPPTASPQADIGDTFGVFVRTFNPVASK